LYALTLSQRRGDRTTRGKAEEARRGPHDLVSHTANRRSQGPLLTLSRARRLGTQLGAKDAAREDALADAAAREKLGAAAGVGKYLGAAPAARGVGVGAGAKRSAEASLPAEPAPGSDKRKKQRGFGDFSAW
jgi:hypothetical protein